MELARTDVVSPMPTLHHNLLERLSTFAALAAVVLVAASVHLVIMRGTTFYVDEWSAIFEYGWSPQQILEPVNGHNAFLGRLSWYAVMAVFGIGDYLPFRVLGLAFNVFTALALFVYGYRRSGPVPALSLCTLSLFLGSSFHTILWPASAIGIFSMGALVLALLSLERDGHRGGLTALALVLLAFGSGGMGVVVYCSVTAEVVLRRQLERWWLVVVPPLAYAIWLVSAGRTRPQDGFSIENISAAPSYVIDALRLAVAGLLGREQSWATGILVAYVALAVILVAYNRERIDFVRVASLSTAPVTFWLLTAVFRGGLGEAGAPRYIAFGALPLALILLELARGLPSRPALVTGAVAVAAVSVAGNLPMLLTAGRNFRYVGEVHRSELAALEAVRPVVSRNYVPPGEWARYVKAGRYFSAVDRFGSPAMPFAALPRAGEGARTLADQVLLDGGQVVAEDVGPRPTCPGATTATTFVVAAGSTVTFANRSDAAAEIRLRRFSAALSAEPLATLRAGGTVRLTVWPDRMPSVHWQVRSSVPVAGC